jgi:hypothetical protein
LPDNDDKGRKHADTREGFSTSSTQTGHLPDPFGD